ncbi:MAG: LVIVD repeat-containing protein [Granulosicoccus sp.]
MYKALRISAYLLLAFASVVASGCSENSDGSGSGTDRPGQTGTAGSTARMIIDGDFLYAISGNTVQLFDISAPATPVAWNQVNLLPSSDIQTLFAYENYLLVGAADGIQILDNTDRASPRPVGDFRHAVTRDPVVAQDDVAYATLRRDDTQPGTDIVNQLNVIDISNVETPELVQVQDDILDAPSGLAVRGDRLFVCDGESGMKIFDITEKFAPNLTQILNYIDCDDVIATDDTLHVIGPRDYSQYNTSLTPRPQLMSTIRREPVIYLVDR